MREGELGQLTRNGETGTVRFVRRYAVAPEELWPFLTESAHLSEWITAGASLEPWVGGRISFPWKQGAPMVGTVSVLDPPHTLQYVWREGSVESIVRMQLEPDGAGTLLVLEHTGLPLREDAGFAAGWHSHLDWLDAAIAGRAAAFDEPSRFRELARAYGYEGVQA